MLEKMRTMKKESKTQVIPEDAFILPNFKQLPLVDKQAEEEVKDDLLVD